MYHVKRSWVGQTFALATSSDPGGKRTRIHRSKEERKAMVESFIKQYQSSNGGNFPSLNLTHKEVGGSFYTVRQIVREIIQENRVLGPARFDTKQQKDAEDLEQQKDAENLEQQYPLGSISTVPLDHLFGLSKGNITDWNNRRAADVELALNIDECYFNQQSSDSVLHIDGTEAHGTSAVRTGMEELRKESDELNGTMVDGTITARTRSYESQETDKLNDHAVDETGAGRTQIDETDKESEELNGTVVGRSSSGHAQIHDISNKYGTLNGSDIVETSASGAPINKIDDKSDELNGAVDGETNDSWTQPDVTNKESNDLNETVADTTKVSRTGVNEISEDSNELPYKESLTSETSDAIRVYEVAVTGTSKLSSPTEEVLNETFPVQPAIKELDGLDGASDGSGALGGSFVGLRTEKVDIGSIGSGSEQMGFHGNSSNLMNGEATNDYNADMSERNPGSSIEQMVLNTSIKSTETMDTVIREDDVIATQAPTGNIVKIFPDDASSKRMEQSNKMAGAEFKSSVDGSIARNLNGTASINTAGLSVSSKETVIADAENSAQQGNTQTLKRINLESWEGTSKRTKRSESNPLLAFVKAVVSAFVKFWSD